MKVQIKEIRSGRIKTVEKRFADILVKLKQAEYFEPSRNTYQTKVMTAAPDLTIPVSPPAAPSAPANPTNPALPIPPALPQEPLEFPAETVNNNGDKPKHRGRPRKNNYKTKVMTAEE